MTFHYSFENPDGAAISDILRKGVPNLTTCVYRAKIRAHGWSSNNH